MTLYLHGIIVGLHFVPLHLEFGLGHHILLLKKLVFSDGVVKLLFQAAQNQGMVNEAMLGVQA